MTEHVLIDEKGGVPHLSVAEGDVLDVARLLLSGQGALPPELASLGSPRRVFSQVLARHVAVICVRTLVEQGGVKERTVIRGGTRESGRIFDAVRVEGLSLPSPPPLGRCWSGPRWSFRLRVLHWPGPEKERSDRPARSRKMWLESVRQAAVTSWFMRWCRYI